RLRQVERVLALDVPRAHVVADRVADDRAARGHDERELGLGHIPACVAADPHGLAAPTHTMRRRLEEELRALGVIHAIVEVTASRRPTGLALEPPNATGSSTPADGRFTITSPASIRLMNSYAEVSDRVQTAADSPKRMPLASSTA